MQQNLGVLEQVARVTIGFSLLYAAFLVAGPMKYLAWAGFLVFAISGFTGKCLVYRLLGIRTG